MKQVVCIIGLLVAMFMNSSVLHAQDLRAQKYLDHLLEEKIRWPEGIKPLPLPEANQTENTIDERKLTFQSNRSLSEGEAHIAVNPIDSLNLVLSYMQIGQTGLSFPIFVTYDGGDTWLPRSLNTTSIFNIDTTGIIIAGGGDPIFAFDADGKLYFSWLLAGVNISDPTVLFMRMFWAYSDDGGFNWNHLNGPGRLVAQGGLNQLTGAASNFDIGVPDRQWMACDLTGGTYANSLYLASLFVKNDSGPAQANGMVVRFKRPADSTFQQTFVQVGTPGTFVSQFANIAVDSEGFVHVSYGSIGVNGRYNGIWHAISRDGGQSFGPSVIVATITDNNGTNLLHERENAAPSLATGPNPGEVYLTWSSWEVEFGNPIVKGFFSRSTDYGQTWSSPQDLNILDGSGQLQHALFPVVATNAKGQVSVAWYASDLTKQSNYVMVTSDDGGQTFSAPLILSTATTDFSIYGQNEFFGDYFNLVRVGCKTFSVWADGRQGTGPKMYVGRVDHCSPVSGLEESPLSAGWSISYPYPNPVKQSVQLDLTAEKSGNWTVNLVSVEGKQLGQVWSDALPAGKHQLSFDLPAVAPGSYWLHINDGAARATRMIVKK